MCHEQARSIETHAISEVARKCSTVWADGSPYIFRALAITYEQVDFRKLVIPGGVQRESQRRSEIDLPLMLNV